MFVTSRMHRRTLAVVLAAGALGVSGLTTGVAAATEWESDTLYASEVVYVLTESEQDSVCGDFGGTIIYSDGYAVDCPSGEVTYTPPEDDAS